MVEKRWTTTLKIIIVVYSKRTPQLYFKFNYIDLNSVNNASTYCDKSVGLDNRNLVVWSWIDNRNKKLANTGFLFTVLVYSLCLLGFFFGSI